MAESAIRTIDWPHELPDKAAPGVAVVHKLIGAGFRAYLVGGAVRDLLLGRQPGDFDIATDAPPQAVVDLFERTATVGAAFGVVVVVQDQTAVEVATFRTEEAYGDRRHPDRIGHTDSLAVDAARRDFTVNALYLSPAERCILDPVGGARDCQDRLLRTVGPPSDRFREDALRLLRAPRLAAQCELTIEEDTRRALTEHREAIRHVSAERVGKEIGLVLTCPAAVVGLEMLHLAGLLEIVLPEVAAMDGVPQPPEYHPEGDVWTHTLLLFRHSPSRSLPLGLAVLLHDVGKPPTMTRTDRIRFNGHAKLGAEMTAQIGRRLRLPNAAIEHAADLVAQHLRFLDVKRMRQATLKRFLRQPNFADHLELHRLDCLASHGDLGNYDFCLRALAELSAQALDPRPLLSGRDLLRLGYREGPLIGKILRDLESAQLEGELVTREQAAAWVKATYRRDADEA